MTSKPNRTGRNDGKGRFIQLPFSLMDTPAWDSLKPVDKVLYLELKRLYNGHNNGCISLSERQAAKAVGVSRQTISRAFERLMDRGFIKIAAKGAFSRKHADAGFHRATQWLLTEHPQNCSKGSGRIIPSAEFKRWLPK